MSDWTDRKPGSGLTPESFQMLLDWLDPDAERAGRKYEEIRHSLIKIFVWRGCADAEGLADETIDRVARKLPEVASTYQGDPALYFYGVARNVLRELARKQLSAPPLPPPPAQARAEQTERMKECLSKCLKTLSPSNRDLILHYYQGENRAKTDARRALASKLNIQAGKLRVRVHRIRSALHTCIEECMAAREE